MRIFKSRDLKKKRDVPVPNLCGVCIEHIVHTHISGTLRSRRDGMKYRIK